MAVSGEMLGDLVRAVLGPGENDHPFHRRIAQDFLQQRPSPYPSLLDSEGKAAIAYGVFGVPETFFIDGNGRIVDKHVGPMTRSTIAALATKAKEGAR